MNYRYLLTSLKVLLAATCMVATGASQAHALDGKVYPGSMCVRWSAGGIPAYYNSFIGNSSTSSSMGLDCPAIHDSHLGINNGWVRVIDRNYNDPVTCGLIGAYHSGARLYGWVAGWNSSNGGSATSSSEHLPFGSFRSPAHGWAHYYYSCRIPTKYNGQVSYITSYFVEENE
jgi:hypothetical protein